METVRAVVLRGMGGPLNMEILRMEGPRDDEVLVSVVASGICHTDIDLCDDWDEETGPVVLGHEGAGIVEKTGGKVEGVVPGDRVVLSYQSCGLCPPCRAGRPFACLRFFEANFGFRRLDGSNALERSGVRGHFFGQSSFADRSLATERNLVKVPGDLHLEMLAPLGCGMQTGAGTVMNALAVRPGQGIAVFGTGAVGLAAVMAARIAGARPVVGVDVLPRRIALALELGATHGIDGRREDVRSRIGDIAGRGVHYVIDTTGDPGLARIAAAVLRPGGTAAFLAGTGAPASLPGGRKAVEIIQGNAVPQRFIPEMISWHRSGRFPFDRLVKFYDFGDIDRAVADAKRGDTIKPVLRWSGRGERKDS